MAIPWLIGAAVVATIAAVASSDDDSESESKSARQAEQCRKQAEIDREESRQRELKKKRIIYVAKLTEIISKKYQIYDDVALLQIRALIQIQDSTPSLKPLLKSKPYKNLGKLEQGLERKIVSIRIGEKILEEMHEYFK